MRKGRRKVGGYVLMAQVLTVVYKWYEDSGYNKDVGCVHYTDFSVTSDIQEEINVCKHMSHLSKQILRLWYHSTFKTKIQTFSNGGQHHACRQCKPHDNSFHVCCKLC